jgi:hypothetical protein
MMIAVEDSAKAAAMTKALAVPWPIATKAPPSKDLNAAEAKHKFAHHLEPLKAELKANHEQQQDDAKFSNRGDGLSVGDTDPVQPRHALGKIAQSRRAHRHADHDKAKHRADFETVEQRDHHRSGGENHQGFFKHRRINGSSHDPMLEQAGSVVTRVMI